MKSEEYVDGAIRTESSRFDSLNVDPAVLESVLKLVIAAGKAVDTLKRGLFYGKPVNEIKLQEAMDEAAYATTLYEAMPHTILKGYSSEPAVSPRIVHSTMGLATEAAEILEKVLLSLQTGQDFDYANLFEELSDENWYMALGIDASSKLDPESAEAGGTRTWSYESIWEKNLAKLKARYPNKFETERAYERNLEAEKKALE